MVNGLCYCCGDAHPIPETCSRSVGQMVRYRQAPHVAKLVHGIQSLKSALRQGKGAKQFGCAQQALALP